jgi:hypothetical protein
VRRAFAPNHWFDFSATRLADYRVRFDERFCLVVDGSETLDDAYVIPFAIAKTLFTADAVDHRGRWVGTIKHNVIRLTPSGREFDVTAYHNAFELL